MSSVKAADSDTCIARSEHTATYLSQAELVRAQKLMAIQKSRSEGADIFGEQMEQVLSEIMGGYWPPKRSNRAVADFYDADGIGYSSKTLLLDPVKSRPLWQQRLGEAVCLPISKLTPTGSLPKGKTVLDASPRTIGNRLIEAYNAMLDRYGVERLAVTLRLRVDEEEHWRYLYWEEDLEPLDPKAYRWANSERSTEGWTRNLRAVHRDADPESAPALNWQSAGKLWMRHTIPADADTWAVPDSMILDRATGNAAISQAIDSQLGI